MKLNVTKISLKLIMAVGVITIVIIGMFSYFSINAQSDALLSQAGIHANKLSDAIKNSTLTGMLENKKEEIHAIINTVSHEPSIMEIRILNKEGVVTFSSRKELVGKMVDKRAESCYACHTENQPLERLSIDERMRIYRIDPVSPRILAVINPIYNEPSCYQAACHAHTKDQTVLGVLDIKMDLKDVDRQIEDNKFRLIVFAVIAILALSVFIALFVRKWIGGPVSELVKATNQVSSGNLDYTIDNPGKDELGTLARSFNKMTKNLAEAKLQLFQADKMASLGRLAAGVAHEINNPLTGVLTYGSFLLKRTKDNPELQESLGVIVRETIRSREIVKGLLDFSRQSVPKKHNADINRIIRSAVEVVANQLSLKRIELDAHLDASLPEIAVDSNQMQQVFINLLVNSADAIGDDGGRISVTPSLISLSPHGLAQIKAAVCPKRHDLMDSDVKCYGFPTVRVKAASRGNEGIVNLDPVYGKHRHQYGIEIAGGSDLQLSCPQCKVSLIAEDVRCPKCGSPVYTFEVLSHGMLEGCTRPECDWQRWPAMDEAGHKDYIEVKIADTGQGIAKEELSRIFEPFYTTKGQSGTGLGLAVTWGIINNHNGTIDVESEPGKGTTFIVHLPLH
ncbi:MAG: two-component sensor histidine kinase [Betaproteobacteria bacterium RIFCSPLOWO2_12_FULL_65_110]|nr:MAG: two-component sensor histidine kinase [Betaproteobacteria bacterium RIFCSPLOWO2_12_FULL_65_110]